MTLLVPLGLALGLSIPVVMIFYLLKVRRHDAEVSSTYLWDDIVRDLAAHEPLQRLRLSILLLFQVAALSLLTLAFARPAWQTVGPPPEHAVLLLDTSASMQATDVSPTRFARAIEQARSTLDRLPENSLATVMLVGPHPQVLVSATTDRAQASAALTAAQATSGPGGMREGLLLARSLGGDPGARHIYVFTDGAFTVPADLPVDLGWLSIQQVAASGSANVGITQVSARPDPGDSQRQQVFARVQNFGVGPTDVSLTVSVDGTQVDQRTLAIPGDGASEQVFDNFPPGARLARLELRDAPGQFSLDKDAFVVLQQRQPAQVLLVTDSDQALRKLLSLLPGITVFQVQPRRYAGIDADQYDIVVFDGYMPPTLPRGNMLAINPPDRGAIRTTGDMPAPRPAVWDRADPLLSYVDVANIVVRRGRRLVMPAWAHAVVSTSSGAPLLAVGQEATRRGVIIPFDLQESNLPVSAAFPILISNALAYLAPPGIVEAPQITTGGIERLAPLPQVRQVQVTDPQNRTTQLSVGSGPLVFRGTDLPGIYRVKQAASDTGGTAGQQEDLFAANLVNPDESDLRPRLAALEASQPAVSMATDPVLRKDVWGLALAAALPLLLLEWFWFHRRT